MSEGYGGMTSKKNITEQSGVLDGLVPGDIILANRGFSIYELVAVHMAELKIPDCTRRKSRLHPREIEDTREIANVRIHVEHAIGLLRNKFTILQDPLPISLLKKKYKKKKLVDYIVRVCAILSNMTEAVVPM